MKIKHSLVVPCYNEQESIEAFLAAAENAMSSYTNSYEIVFVNDGSADNTLEILHRLFKTHKNTKIKVVSFSRNFGKESAMYAGLTEAAGEYVTIIDADLQQRPEVAVEMGKILDEHPEYDMVAAFQAERKENKFIASCKDKFYKVINKMTEVRFIPNASDFRTLRRPVVDSILELSEYHRFSKGLFSWVGYNVYSIPYEVQEREGGESKWNFKKLLKYALDGIMAYTDLPLKLPLYWGVGSGIISVILFIVLLIVQLACKANVGLGYIACLMIFLSAILFIGQGIMGAYLGKVHTQVKKRPVYIAKEKLSYEDDKTTY